ncbi:MAG: hypothetical protein JXX28_07210 [Deltaproteobacteria bacterium]|nr:hypothetical protein [Deltaproteobacteria bacterium]
MLLVLTALLIGCQAPEVVLSGVIPETRFADAGPLVGGTLSLRDAEGARYGQTTTAEDGSFSLGAPAGEAVFLEVSGGDALVAASFSGVTGLAETLALDPADRLLYGLTAAELTAWRGRFAGCPGADAVGTAAVIGEVRVWELADEAGEHPLVTKAWVELSAFSGARWTACYLDDDGLAWSEGATYTGQTGVFAVFGLPAGGYSMEVSYLPHEEADPVTAWSELYLSAGGVAPRFPAWVRWWA